MIREILTDRQKNAQFNIEAKLKSAMWSERQTHKLIQELQRFLKELILQNFFGFAKQIKTDRLCIQKINSKTTIKNMIFYCENITWRLLRTNTKPP